MGENRVVAQAVDDRDEPLDGEAQKSHRAADREAEIVTLNRPAYRRSHLAADDVIRPKHTAAEEEPGLAERQVADGLEHREPAQGSRCQDRHGGDARVDRAEQADHRGAHR